MDITSKGVFEEGFLALVKNLLWVSGGCAVFSGARGSLFTLEYAFLNRRIRCGLFRSLMEQVSRLWETRCINMLGLRCCAGALGRGIL